ncbi:hypothetical protein OUZ56_006193 [Daphnia magna]|uniref:Uncharacterized protein n=1 Tax=Daphnia magna TaxID=35525 RepID=A0ABQ9YVI4_9CRUS|nr:hypothetical protein OUZ56_006193 [Daphnia magna]
MLAASLIESLQQDKGKFSQIILCGKVRGNSEKHRHPDIMADFDIARLRETFSGRGLQSTPLTAHRSTVAPIAPIMPALFVIKLIKVNPYLHRGRVLGLLDCLVRAE